MFYKTPWRTENTAETWIRAPKEFLFMRQEKKKKRPCCRGEAMDTIERTTSTKLSPVTTGDVEEDDHREFCQPLDRTRPDEDFQC